LGVGLTTLPCKKENVEKCPRNSAGFCGGGQGPNWAVEPRKERKKDLCLFLSGFPTKIFLSFVLQMYSFLYFNVLFYGRIMKRNAIQIIVIIIIIIIDQHHCHNIFCFY
jgi:hypothetical protein